MDNLLREFQNPVERTARDAWMIQKITAEFTNGFDLMRKVDPAVSIFGSARLKKGSRYWKLCEQTAKVATSTGFSLISGGGPGLMEAANKGAFTGIREYKKHFPNERPPINVGLTIELPFEAEANPHVDLEVHFRYFFVRKVMFARYARAFVIMPGGFGTLDELFEALTLMQTDKMEKFPVVLMGSEYWQGLIDWMRSSLLKTGALSEKDFSLFHVLDDPEEAIEMIAKRYADLVRLIRRRRRRKPKRKTRVATKK